MWLQDMLVEKYDQIKFVPFNPVDKYTVAIVMDKESCSTFRILKGAPQVSQEVKTFALEPLPYR